MLDRIKLMVARGDWVVGFHARGRGNERNATRADIYRALMTATSATLQSNGRWRVNGGTDTEGDELTVICAVEANVIVVTIY